jgi:hypothetical protein
MSKVRTDHMDLAEAVRFTKHDFRSSFLSTLHDWDLFEKSGAARLKSLETRLENYRASPFETHSRSQVRQFL